MEPADHDMYRAAIHGDLEAFEFVIRNMSRPLFAIAFGALQNREEGEDVVQDAFVKAWKARWQVRNPETFPAWIATIVRNRAHDILMRRRTIPMEEQFNELPSDLSAFLTPNSGVQLRWAHRLESLCSAARSRPLLLETFKHRKITWRLCARRKPDEYSTFQPN
jgi:RNA polymerase sigma factor (sigma-70 family)